MKRKRAPGGGRKPRGEYPGKTATLTTRITPKTRAALESAARNSGRSLSQEVEFHLILALGGSIERVTLKPSKKEAKTSGAGLMEAIEPWGAPTLLRENPDV